MQQHHAIGSQQLVHPGEELAVVAHAYVLEHANAGDLVEKPVFGQVEVIEQLHAHAAAEKVHEEAKRHVDPRKHEKGVLSMARTNDPNSAGSQFFETGHTELAHDENVEWCAQALDDGGGDLDRGP